MGCAPYCNSYTESKTFDDAGNVVTDTYPSGETVTNSYGSQGWLSGVSTSQGSTTLLSGAAYTGTGGANGLMTSANLGGTTYQYSAGFDPLARATDLRVTRSSDQATMFDQTRTFDAAGNVSTSSTTLPGGTDNQAFCYDEQHRLTWAGSTGTPPCTGTAISAGSLTAAQYTQTFSYDTMGRLTNGPLGAYTYGDSNHIHAMTQAWPYTASYDAAGDMTCRSPNSGFSVGCIGQQTGDLMTYNNEGQLSNWQTPPGTPTITVAFLYDGQGNRVAQQLTQGGSTTTTVYLGGLEEDSTTGNTTTKTTYYYADGVRIAMAVNGAFSYLASDGLGSANVTLNGGGTATASVLYAPYGLARFTSGTMPTSRGFTGQIADSTSGLDYYGARYYDPTAAQFTTADTMLPRGGFGAWGLSRYAYVEGNPIVYTDPTGQASVQQGIAGGCDPNNAGCQASQQGDIQYVKQLLADAAASADRAAKAARRQLVINNATALIAGPSLHDYANTEASMPGLLQVFDFPIFQTADWLTNGRTGPSPLGTFNPNDPSSLVPFALMADVGGGPHPSTPVGRRGHEINVPDGTNKPATAGGINYSGHAQDRMQGQGIFPSVVKNAIENGQVSRGNTPNTLVYYDPMNDVTVIQNYVTGNVVTVHYGKP